MISCVIRVPVCLCACGAFFLAALNICMSISMILKMDCTATTPLHSHSVLSMCRNGIFFGQLRKKTHIFVYSIERIQCEFETLTLTLLSNDRKSHDHCYEANSSSFDYDDSCLAAKSSRTVLDQSPGAVIRSSVLVGDDSCNFGWSPQITNISIETFLYDSIGARMLCA